MSENINIPIVVGISDKSSVWFQESNQYVLMHPIEADLLLKIYIKESKAEIIKYCEEELNFNKEDSENLIKRIQDLIDQQKEIEKNRTISIQENSLYSPTDLSIQRYYQIHNKVFFVEYQSAELELLIHPKFSHLEMEETGGFSSHFQVFKQDDNFILKVDGEMIGAWNNENLHFLSGKFSMEFVNKMYEKKEDDWLGVFHASAIGDGNNALMFTGESGNGKSTICSILMSHGFNLIADDFVPLNNTLMINSFPAALSVKKTAWDMLSKAYPDLIKEKEHEILKMNKTVKYLSPLSNSFKNSFPVKALILVKFQSDVSCELSSIPNDEAFQKLVPDSWLSPISANAEKFLNWFAEMPCYRLIYSDNQKMLSEVKGLFENEL